MRNHPEKLSRVGIGKWRYAELRAICRQYPEDKRALENARRGIVDRRPGRGAWKAPDPTGDRAVALAAMPQARVVSLVERSAEAVASGMMIPALIESVSKGRPYYHLDHRPPCGEKQFSNVRLNFYIELDRRMCL